MSQSALFLSVLFACLAATTERAHALIVPRSNCGSCPSMRAAPPLISRCKWSEVCEAEFLSTPVSDGVPQHIASERVDCKKCATVDGQPCDPNIPVGASTTCSVEISITKTLEWDVSLTGSGGIDIGIFNKEFEASIGRTSAVSTTATAEGILTAPWCKHVKGSGMFRLYRDAGFRVDAKMTLVTEGVGSHSSCSYKIYRTPCPPANAVAIYDKRLVAIGVSQDEVNTCKD